MTYKQAKEQGYKGNWTDFRKAYSRWNVAKAKGYDISLLEYLEKPRVKLLPDALPSKYYHQKRTLKQALATPKWVDIEKLCKIYAFAPNGMQVDHIVPLQGKNVSGLHVPWNLQYLWPHQNARKGNKVAKNCHFVTSIDIMAFSEIAMKIQEDTEI